MLLLTCCEPAYLWPYTAYVLLMMGEIVAETCRVKPLRRIKTQLLHLVGLISLLYLILVPVDKYWETF